MITEQRHDQIDRSKQMLTRLPVSGEQVWVPRPDNYADAVDAARQNMPALQGPQIAGSNQCPHCGQGFASPRVLTEHISVRHPIASGQADMSLVTLPDGTQVPAAAVPEITLHKHEQELACAKAREAELEAKLEELAKQLAGRSLKPSKDR